MFLQTKRELCIKLFYYDGEYFVRIREVAGVLGVKQQFEFTSNIKKELGDCAILSGDKTETFRDNTVDENRTTFISIRTLFKFLYSGKIYHKMIGTKVQELMDELIQYI